MGRPSRGLASRAGPCILTIFFFLVVAAPTVLAFDPNFDFYPKDAQACLLDAAKASKCQGDTSAALNACLCGNGGGFVVRTAQCLGKKDKKDVAGVYDTMADACAHSSTPLKLEKDDFADAASDAVDNGNKSSSSSSSRSNTATKTSSSSTSASNTASKTPSSSSSTTTPSATSSPTASPTTLPDSSSKGSSDGKKLSTAGTIGVAAGVSIAGVAAIAGLAWFLVRRRKHSTGVDESHPMLPREKYGGGGGATTFPPREPSPTLGVGGGELPTEHKLCFIVWAAIKVPAILRVFSSQ
ncbi:hypothetical protein LLEC1_03388 [Akanthomyces lecanii]|uniref:Extracellular membrane protein CFEM domain-containing protein n=1 Tax=Cordyceps confragosa TaxID=2714763 RepID=A0A179IIF9_CORDF|nr:hypothetical protein LLEC1_03388 [Akanthomyces lecanii]